MKWRCKNETKSKKGEEKCEKYCNDWATLAQGIVISKMLLKMATLTSTLVGISLYTALQAASARKGIEIEESKNECIKSCQCKQS